MQRPTAITFIGRQPQVIDENRERGQREVIGEDDSDAQCGLTLPLRVRATRLGY
jgi:hypothetical protein